ncbi:MAG: DUF1624 domain-containing protein [Candidatus Hodarchaeales archaeon]|jgi:uncharacterized membrane protein
MITKEKDELETKKVSIPRIPAIDFVRGLVIILMALDHASTYWNSGRYFGEFWFASRPELLPDLLQFIVRFVSHWCAPSFVFLAGVSIILFEVKRLEKGVSQSEITKQLVIRGLILLLIEWTIIAWMFQAEALYFGVLAAIGVGLIFYAFVRMLDTKIILAFSLLVVLSPVFAHFIWNPLFDPGNHPTSFSIFYFGLDIIEQIVVDPQILAWIQAATFSPEWPYGLYPLDPWLGVMGLGVVFGRWLVKQQQKPETNRFIAKRLALASGVSIGLFFIIRTTQGLPFNYQPIWADQGVLIENAFSIQNYFFLSKYPPSIAFLLWTLGGMCLVLAVAFYFQDREWFQKWSLPVILFGSTPLFFYTSHLILYGVVPTLLNLLKAFSLQITLIVWILGLIILYPICIEFRKLKKKYPNTPLKYI